MGVSCYAILAANPSSASGFYTVLPAGAATAVRMYCDMTTDGGGYSYYACVGCPSVSMVTQPNGCAAAGLAMVIPRTQNHWVCARASKHACAARLDARVVQVSMFNFVTRTLGSSNAEFFTIVPSVYKASSGLSNCPPGSRSIGACWR